MASLSVENIPICPTILTMSKGKMILMPMTAIAIHRVRNLCCRFSSIFLRIFALTTALSKESDTSRTPRMNTIKTVWSAFMTFRSCPSQRKNHNMTATMVKIIDHLKNFI